MKRTLSVLFALLLTGITASAQIQNGYVRSQGTSYNRTGSPLKGARVFVKGLNGAKVTATNGTFNFNLGGGKTQFSISTVTLKGYSLLSPLPPAYNVGKATVEIVMQSREERIQNEARISKIIEERITKSYDAKTKELQKKIAALEKALSDKKRNSNELESQIRSLKEQMGNLDNQYLKRNELIDKIVEEYVNLDYATMDNRKAELCLYIESGELEKADSLLNTIDIYKEMNDIKTLNQDIEEKESMLEKEKEIRKNKIETACMYWRGKYNIAIQNMQYDSAAVYIRNLADVDTCNFENVFDCANYLREQNYFKEAEEYYNKILKTEQENQLISNNQIAALYNNLALLYSGTQRFKESEEMLKAGIQIYERLEKENQKVYESDLATSYNNLALLYSNTQRFKESEEMYKAAIQIRERLVKENQKAYESDLASSYNNLALLYSNTQKFKESEEMYKAAIQIYERLAKENPKVYEKDLARSYSNLALLYNGTQRLKESEEMHKAAIQIYERLYNNNPQEYQKVLAFSYYCLGTLMTENNKQDDAIGAFEHSIKLSKEFIKEDDFKQIYLSNLLYIVILHQQVGNIITAYTYNEDLLPLLKNLYEEDSEKWKSSYCGYLIQQSYLANLLGKFKDGELYSLEELKVDPNNHRTYTNLAASLLLQGRLEEAEKLFREYKAELKDEFLNDLAKFESLRVIPEKRKADVERIKAILSE